MKTHYYSHGIIPVYQQDGEIYICAIKNMKSGEWGMPKGSPEKGESPMETATRELVEETGITEFEIIDRKTLVERHTFEHEGAILHKENTYWVAKVPKMTEKPIELDARDMKWINAKDADDFFKFEGVKKLVREVESIYFTNL